MDAARHQGQSAGGPPPEGTVPVPPSDATASSRTNREWRAAAGYSSDSHRPHRGARSGQPRPRRPARSAAPLSRRGRRLRTLPDVAGPPVRAGRRQRAAAGRRAAAAGADIESLIADVTPEPWRDAVRRGDPAEWLIEFAEVGRVRCATFRDHRGPGANFHFTFSARLRPMICRLEPGDASARDRAGRPGGRGWRGGQRQVRHRRGLRRPHQPQRADYVITLEPQVRVLHEQPRGAGQPARGGHRCRARSRAWRGPRFANSPTCS